MPVAVTVPDDAVSAAAAEESVRDILAANRLLSMATVDDGEPHINTAFYAYDDELRLYILTPPETRHCRNLAAHPSVAVDVHDSRQAWTADKQGLQLFGTAARVDDTATALDLYRDRFPDVAAVAATPDAVEQLDSVFYRIVPARIKIFDEPRFGTETWITVEVTR